MDERYLPPIVGGRWAISREIHGRWITLIENTPVDDENDILSVLEVLKIVSTLKNIEQYFPFRSRVFPNRECGRSPTLELLELFSRIGREGNGECGV